MAALELVHRAATQTVIGLIPRHKVSNVLTHACVCLCLCLLLCFINQADKRRQAELQATADKAKAAKDPAAAAAEARRKWWGQQQYEEREQRRQKGEDGEDEDDDIAYYRCGGGQGWLKRGVLGRWGLD